MDLKMRNHCYWGGIIKIMEQFRQPVDPSNSQFNEKQLKLERVRKGLDKQPLPLFINKNTNEEFFKLEHKYHQYPKFQRLVSVFVKGVINTADIIRYKKSYFSHKQNLNNVAEGDPRFLQEVAADNILLNYIFGDDDHRYFAEPNAEDEPYSVAGIRIPGPATREEGHHWNIVANEQRNNKYYFDLAKAGDYLEIMDDENPDNKVPEYFIQGIANNKTITEEEKNNFKNILIKDLDVAHIPDPQETFTILKDKCETLINREFSLESYETFKAMVEYSGIKLNEEVFTKYNFEASDFQGRLREFFQDLSNRLKIMNEVAVEKLRSLGA